MSWEFSLTDEHGVKRKVSGDEVVRQYTELRDTYDRAHRLAAMYGTALTRIANGTDPSPQRNAAAVIRAANAAFPEMFGKPESPVGNGESLHPNGTMNP